MVVCYYGITGAHVNLMSACWTTHAPQGAQMFSENELGKTHKEYE